MPLFLASGGLSALPALFAGNQNARVAFVGAAAERDDDPFWLQRDRDALRSFGWSVTDFELTGTPAQLSAALENADVVFLAGGNTYLLLHRLRSSGMDRILDAFLARGGVYAGSSAGAIVTAPDIELTAEPDQRPAVPELRSTLGLAWVPFAVLPHAGRRTQRFVDHHNDVLRRGLGAPIVRITDDEAVVVDDAGWHLVWSPSDPTHAR